MLYCKIYEKKGFKMKVRMFDLRVKDRKIRKELKKNFEIMLDHGKFFFGPELYRFEKKMSWLTTLTYIMSFFTKYNRYQSSIISTSISSTIFFIKMSKYKIKKIVSF